MDFDQLRADMEAGTQGDWFAGWGEGLTGPSMSNAQAGTNAGMYPIGASDRSCVGATSSATPVIDARRIARVPQLERIALAAEALAEMLDAFIGAEVDYMDTNNLGDPGQQHNVIWGRKALAAYREATKT